MTSAIALAAWLALAPAPAVAEPAGYFQCEPLAPPPEQGTERFFRVALAEGAARLEVAGLVGPYADLTQGVPLRYAMYSESASHAAAAWGSHDEVALSLMYFGSWWGGNLRAFGEETDLRCRESAPF